MGRWPVQAGLARQRRLHHLGRFGGCHHRRRDGPRSGSLRQDAHARASALLHQHHRLGIAGRAHGLGGQRLRQCEAQVRPARRRRAGRHGRGRVRGATLVVDGLASRTGRQPGAGGRHRRPGHRSPGEGFGEPRCPRLCRLRHGTGDDRRRGGQPLPRRLEERLAIGRRGRRQLGLDGRAHRLGHRRQRALERSRGPGRNDAGPVGRIPGGHRGLALRRRFGLASLGGRGRDAGRQRDGPRHADARLARRRREVDAGRGPRRRRAAGRRSRRRALPARGSAGRWHGRRGTHLRRRHVGSGQPRRGPPGRCPSRGRPLGLCPRGGHRGHAGLGQARSRRGRLRHRRGSHRARHERGDGRGHVGHGDTGQWRARRRARWLGRRPRRGRAAGARHALASPRPRRRGPRRGPGHLARRARSQPGARQLGEARATPPVPPGSGWPWARPPAQGSRT